MDTETSDPTELLRWWHQHQAQMLNRETDFVRNGLLQEIIAIRRRLEVSCPLQSPRNDLKCGPHLADLHRLYGLLENFCDRLESPYLQDSLPLALQHIAQPWQTRLNLRAQLPATWGEEPIEQARLLTLLLKTALTNLGQAPVIPRDSVLTMSEDDGLKTLVLEAQYPSALTSLLMQQLPTALHPLLETFQLFTQADCDYRFQADSFSLELGWRDPDLNNSDYRHHDCIL